jgi:hypothetical protein
MELCNLGAARTIIAKQGTQAGTVGIFNLICGSSDMGFW